MSTPKEEHEPILKQWDEENPKQVAPVVDEPLKPRSNPLVVVFWMLVNVTATVGIVFTNKAIFTDKSLVQMPVSSLHFISSVLLERCL